MIEPKRVVLDTNVCLDLFVFEDARWQLLLQDLQDRKLLAVTSDACRNEWQRVLNYPHLPVTEHTKPAIIERFDSLVARVSPTAGGPALPKCSDPDDQKFLEIARDAHASLLISKDKAVLKLARKTKQLGIFSILSPENYIASRQFLL